MSEFPTLLDAYGAANPKPWWKRAPPPTALQLAVMALEECRRDRLEHAYKAEYHTAMRNMLEERDLRLQSDIANLSEASTSSPSPSSRPYRPPQPTPLKTTT